MKKLLLFSILLLSILNALGQNSPWTVMTQTQVNQLPAFPFSDMPRTGYKVFTLDLSVLSNQLSMAPMDSATDSNVIVSFPNPDGGQDSYKIFEVAIMEQALANKYPNIKSYIGKGINDKTQAIRFSITPLGFDAVTNSGKVGSFLIKKHRSNSLINYVVYRHFRAPGNSIYYRNSNSSAKSSDFVCGLADEKDKLDYDKIKNLPKSNQRISDGKLRVYRLAVATTVEFSNTIASQAGMSAGTTAQKKAVVIASLAHLITRLNGDWERDLSVRMKLVDNQEAIIFVDSDNFTNGNKSTLLAESIQITPIIGNANFDIGHVMGTGGAGVAWLGAIAVDDWKTKGVTEYDGQQGVNNDKFSNNVAHEMGHFLGAKHTYSNSDCPNLDSTIQIEPYAGNTYLSYNRLCAGLAVDSDGWQPISDPYYHTASINEIQNVLAQTTSGTLITINNAPPVVSAGPDYTIPKDTPYVLKASVTNSNAEGYTYSWEGLDTGVQPETSATATSGPNFKFNQPTASPNRYMPKLEKVIAGELNTRMERLSSVSRVQNFAVTVRDNAVIRGSNVRRDDMILTVNANAGPFVITSQNTTGITWAGNSSQTITWDVAGTTANNINTSLVNILLSTDKGLTFTTTLLANTPNDGLQVITIPNTINSLDCRLMVQSVGNLFYAVNTTKFAIATNLATNDFEFENFTLFPNPNNGSFKISFKPETNDVIEVIVNDVIGRNIYNKIFQNSGMFNQEFQVNTITAGIYFVKIQNGKNKSVKKIIIK
ncbi:reprolysin-like metallopeptidase [Flavobacterium sp. GSP14]|uniref:zinc-dependent metalloprotease n=1 Tax=Flavobacterium sp. GSP14 TaxID=3401734 RepID=UPI003AAAC563